MMTRTVVGRKADAVLLIMLLLAGSIASAQQGDVQPIYSDPAFYPPAVELADGTILVTFDHPTPGGKAIACVRSTDGGKTWGDYLRIVEDAGRVDVANAVPLQLDGGKTWGSPTTVARKPRSRDGMPAVVRARDGSLLVCFEASDVPPFRFVVRAVRSQDGGISWSAERELIQQPINPVHGRWAAGAPYLVCGKDV